MLPELDQQTPECFCYSDSDTNREHDKFMHWFGNAIAVLFGVSLVIIIAAGILLASILFTLTYEVLF